MSCTLAEIQSAQHDILKEVARVCDLHDIKYFLAQGTLLGAVRHKGFIPWDDDVDIIIPHDQLKRLMKIFPEEANKEYLLTNHHVEKYYPYTWAKIRSVNTLSRPRRYKDISVNWGICIDLFPIYNVSNNPVLRQAEILFFKVARKMLLAEMTKYEENHNLLTRLLEKIPVCIRHFFVDMSLKILSMHKNTDYVYLLCRGGKIVKREIVFGKELTLCFEGIEYPVPSDYHAYLTEMYGDYMTPPPPEEQGGHDLRMGEIEWSL